MQNAKDALDIDKELSKEEEALLRKHLANFLRREPYVRSYPKIGRNALVHVAVARNINIVVEDDK